MTDTTPRSSLVGNALFASVSAGSALLLLALLVVAGRRLGDAMYGQFSFALALVTIFETFMDFGLKEVATRSVARQPAGALTLAANTFGLKIVLSVVTMASLVATAHILTPDADVRAACALLGVSSVLRSYLMTSRHVLMGLERFDLDALIVVTDRLLLLGLGAGVLLLGYGVVALAAMFIVARAVAVWLSYTLSASQIGWFGFRFELPVWRDLQRRAVPFGAFAIVLYLYSYIDTVMLFVLRGDVDTGLYSAAYRIYEGLSNGPSILYAVLGPRLARHFVTSPEHHRRLARRGRLAALALSVPLVLAAVVAAGPAILWLFGPAYATSAPVLQILSAGLLFVFPLYVLHAEAISMNAERLSLGTAAIGCVINVALNAVLIPSYGIHGAAIATLIGEGCSLLVLWWLLERRTS
jgi:O-antigen/teichoic acid export membrane protein